MPQGQGIRNPTIPLYNHTIATIPYSSLALLLTTLKAITKRPKKAIKSDH
nr:MAG TPA: hypothetical protein [Caudoviricetes sp.]